MALRLGRLQGGESGRRPEPRRRKRRIGMPDQVRADPPGATVHREVNGLNLCEVLHQVGPRRPCGPRRGCGTRRSGGPRPAPPWPGGCRPPRGIAPRGPAPRRGPPSGAACGTPGYSRTGPPGPPPEARQCPARSSPGPPPRSPAGSAGASGAHRWPGRPRAVVAGVSFVRFVCFVASLFVWGVKMGHERHERSRNGHDLAAEERPAPRASKSTAAVRFRKIAFWSPQVLGISAPHFPKAAQTVENQSERQGPSTPGFAHAGRYRGRDLRVPRKRLRGAGTPRLHQPRCSGELLPSTLPAAVVGIDPPAVVVTSPRPLRGGQDLRSRRLLGGTSRGRGSYDFKWYGR
jgi:hypothetical protein